MRKGWTETAISDIAEVLSGFAFKSELFSESEGTPLIRIRDLQKRDRTEVGYKGEYEERYVVNRGDFLIGMDGEFRCYEWLGPKALLNQRVCRIQSFDESKIVPRFIYFLVNQYLEKIENSTSFTTVKHISVKQVKDICFPKPTLAEQKRIVDVVSSVDTYIVALQQQADSAREARNAVLHELLSAGSDDWTETTLGEIAKWGSGGTPKSDVASYYDGDIPWCVIGDLTEGEVINTERCISQEGLRNSSAKMIEPGAVMIAMYGASIGRTGIVGVPMATNQAIAFAYVDEAKVVNYFLLLFLQIQKQKFIEAGQGAAQPNISQTVLKDWPILLPSLTEQKRIVEIVSSMDEVIQSTEHAVFDAKALRSGLLSDLLSGNHEIPASYDSFLGAA
jgi:type I restriction enzyme S subunit